MRKITLEAILQIATDAFLLQVKILARKKEIKISSKLILKLENMFRIKHASSNDLHMIMHKRSLLKV